MISLSSLWVVTAGFIIGTIIYRMLTHNENSWAGFADACFWSVGLAITLTVVALTIL